MLRPRPKFDKLASASRFGLGLASVLLTWSGKCAIQCKIILVVYIRGCVIATFIIMIWLGTLMWDKNSVMCCWHCRHVFLFRNIYMWPASTLASETWPLPRGSGLDLGLKSFGLSLGILASFNITDVNTPTSMHTNN